MDKQSPLLMSLLLLLVGVVLLIMFLLLITNKSLKKTKGLIFGSVSLLLVSILLFSMSLYIAFSANKGNLAKIEIGSNEAAPLAEEQEEKKEQKEQQPAQIEDEVSSTDTKLNESNSNMVFRYEPNATEYPIIEINAWEEVVFVKDADGTMYYCVDMMTSEGVKVGLPMDGAIAAFPEDPFEGNGVYNYTVYAYHKGTYHQQIEKHLATYPDLLTESYLYDSVSTERTEEYSNLDKSLYSFIYDYLPTQEPSEIIDVPLLEGNWMSKDETLLQETNVLAQIQFGEDDTIIMENNLIYSSEIPPIAQYKLEPLDTNAFKLYLYPAYVKADDNDGGGLTVSEEPVKRNFIIYLTSDDTFELVFFNNKLIRQSLTMSRVE